MKKVSYSSQPRNNALAEELKKDPEVITLLKALKQDESVVEDHLMELYQYRNQMRFCRQCQQLEMCSASIPGYVATLDEDLLPILMPCRYLRQRNECLAHKKNYLICDLSDKSLAIELEAIDLTKESENYRKVVELAKRIAAKPAGKAPYFYGPLGTGKSYLAAGICNALAKKGQQVGFVNVPSLASGLRSRMGEEDYVSGILYRMRRADCLVLDDIGAENISNYIRDDILYTVLDYRMEHGKTTIFTSNFSMEELKTRMAITNSGEDLAKAQRVMERIATLSGEIPLFGDSRRRI